MGGGGGYGIRGHFGSRDSSDSSPSTHRAATAMASVSVPLRIQGASMLAEAPKVGPAMLLTCEFVMPLGDLVNAMAKYQMQHEAAPAACTEPRNAPATCTEPRSAHCQGPMPQAPAFPEPAPKPEVAESVALPRPEPKTCLGTLKDLALQALRDAENVTWACRNRIEEQVEYPCGSSRCAAYESLRTMHKDCELCQRGEACALGRALLIVRDLLVLTVAMGKGPMTTDTLVTALNEAMRLGCGRDMDEKEQSQLCLAFNKVISLGHTREGFEAKACRPNMYGHIVAVEDVEQLFLEYNSVARASPDYISNNKQSRRHKKRSASPAAAATSAFAATSSTAATSMPMAMSETAHSQETLRLLQFDRHSILAQLGGL